MLILLFSLFLGVSANTLQLWDGSAGAGNRPQCNTCDSTSSTSQCASGLTCESPSHLSTGTWQADYHKAHDGFCRPDNHNDYQLMVGKSCTVGQANCVTVANIEECATLCRGKSWDVSGTRMHGKGFFYSPGFNSNRWGHYQPNCFCQATHSDPHEECGSVTNDNNWKWVRYDFDVPYAFVHYGRCTDNGNHRKQLSGTQYSIERCASECKNVVTQNGKKAIGFAYHHGKHSSTTRAYDGICSCVSRASHPHPDCDLPRAGANWARYDFVNYSPVFEYQHEGRCQTNPMQSYDSYYVLTGNTLERATQCSRMCMGAMVGDEAAKGFVVSGTTCECESDDSSTECTGRNVNDGWLRYDFVVGEDGVYETKGYCNPTGGNTAGFNSAQTTPEYTWVDNCKNKCIAHSKEKNAAINDGKSTFTHFSFVKSDGRCWCMQTSSGAHTEHPCETNGVASSGGNLLSYTIWNGNAIPDVPGCDHSGVDVRGLSVCVDLEPCDPNPCNSGTCTADGYTGYTCNCNPGYSGDNCEINIDECASDPCVHGTCVDLVNDYRCDNCAGFTGKSCDECAHGNGCECRRFGQSVWGSCSGGCTGIDTEHELRVPTGNITRIPRTLPGALP